MSVQKKNKEFFFRVVGGKLRGKKLSIPPLTTTRPAKDRVREAIFNRLACRKKTTGENLLPESWVLDVFAGSGSMGIEAFSRGAKAVYMVENSSTALSILRKNIKKIKDPIEINILQNNALDIPPAPRAMDIVFIDPPYFKNLLSPALLSLQKKGWLNRETVVLAEVDKTEEVLLPKDFRIEGERTYGRVKIIEIIFSL